MARRSALTLPRPSLRLRPSQTMLRLSTVVAITVPVITVASVTVASITVSALPTLAQPNLRSSFPGRRVGGATRGECSARLIAHLVPSTSVFSSGSSRLLGILEGPSANPVPVLVSFRPEGSTNAAATSLLPASGPSIVLLRQPPGSLPTRWTSTYKCDTGSPPPADDPLAFVTTVSPPALTLLVPDAIPEDQRVQQSLQTLLKACGSSIPRAQVASAFGLADVMSEGSWPDQLPVRCPS